MFNLTSHGLHVNMTLCKVIFCVLCVLIIPEFLVKNPLLPTLKSLYNSDAFQTEQLWFRREKVIETEWMKN